MAKIKINENEILSIIQRVLNENRKVIKLPNSAPAQEPMPMNEPMQQPDMGGMDPSMQDPQAQGMPDAEGGMDMGAEGGDSQFDTNFDAGVEADEETDPKRYIQQLTGKLSQSLNSFNNDNGGDAGLCKYVANMIVSAACKYLDDKAKKEVIEKINSASSDEEDTDMEVPDDGNETPMDGTQEEMPQEEQPVMENMFTKKQLRELAIGADKEKRPAETKKIDKEIPKPWKSKF